MKNSSNSSKHRKISSSSGGMIGGGITTATTTTTTSIEYHEGTIGSVGTNSSSGVTGSSDGGGGGIDGNESFGNGGGHIPRYKNSSPILGNHHGINITTINHKHERYTI